jgi:hypothetical protein
MYFIEQIFRVSPDNGTGMLETTILIVVLVIPIAFALLRMRRPRLR